MGAILCALLYVGSLTLIDYQDCVDSSNPSPGPPPPPTLAPTPSPTPDLQCNSNKRCVTLNSNGFGADQVLTFTLACMGGSTIRLLQGGCVQTTSSDLQCSDNSEPTIAACCDEPGSSMFVFGQNVGASSSTLLMTAYATSDASSVSRLGQCQASTGVGSFYTLCTMGATQSGSATFNF